MRTRTIFHFLVMIPLLLWAQEEGSSAPASTYELRGTLRQYAKVFVQDPNGVDLMQSQLKLELLSSLSKSTAFKVVNYSTYESVHKQVTHDLKEAYLDYYSNWLDVRVGKQVTSWGKADELNPTDVLNPQDLTIFTEDKILRKIGLFQFKADAKYKDFVFTGIWKPEFDYIKTPSPFSRWSFYSMPANVASMPAPVCPESRLKNTEGAAKLGWTGHSIDASLSYFDGWDHIATTLIHVNPQTNQPTLASAFYRTKMIGADIAGQLFTFGVWAEGAYFITEDDQGVDPNIKNPYAQFTLGADYQFPNELKVNVQYFQEVITQVDDDAEQTQEEAILTKLGIGLPVQQAASCRIEWKFGASKSNRLELFGLFDIKKNGAIINPKIVLVPEDAFTCELGAYLFNGDQGSIFQRFEKNNEPYVKCTFAF